MIYHPVKQLSNSGITDILIVTSTEHMGEVVNLLGSGISFGCEFTYRVQEEAGGISQALALARSFSNGDKIVVLLGDNIFEYSISQFVNNYKIQEKGARVLLKRVDDPCHFGIAALDEHHVINIEEKPAKPESDYAIVGAYCYDNHVFDIIDNLTRANIQ